MCSCMYVYQWTTILLSNFCCYFLCSSFLKAIGNLIVLQNLISSLLKWYYILSFKAPDIFNLPIVTYYWNRNWLLEECLKCGKLVSNSHIFRCLLFFFFLSFLHEMKGTYLSRYEAKTKAHLHVSCVPQVKKTNSGLHEMIKRGKNNQRWQKLEVEPVCRKILCKWLD